MVDVAEEEQKLLREQEELQQKIRQKQLVKEKASAEVQQARKQLAEVMEEQAALARMEPPTKSARKTTQERADSTRHRGVITYCSRVG